MPFESKSDNFNYELWALAHGEASQSKTTRFLTLSAIFHIALFTAAALLSVPVVEAVKTETITIEIAEPVHQISRGLMIPATEGRKVEEITAVTPVTKDDILRPVAKAAAPAKPIKAAKAKTAAKASRSRVAHHATAAKAIPADQQAAVTAAPKMATIDDIDAPEIDQSAVEAEHISTAAALNDVDQDLEQVDHTQEKVLAEEKSKLDQDADNADAETDQALANLNEDSKAQAAALSEANRDRRAQDAKAIATAAQGERDAQDAATRKATAAQAAAAAAQGAKKHAGNGAGAQGSKQTSANPAGGANGVRSLDQLRQMPGNHGPQYSQTERMKRESGVVSFLAYVTKQGNLAKFKQLSSTGHKNLDSKTLAALQKWRFYPGQEGWVELPIQWDIQGEPQAMGGMLRVSRR